MSLQSAYDVYAQLEADRKAKQDDPLAKGLAVGQNAYNSSKGAYDYLAGKGTYPVSNLVSNSYETTHGITGPTSQQAIAQAAKDAPYRGKTVSGQDVADQIQTQPGAAASLINMALPAYVGYKFLVPAAVKNSIASALDMPSLAAGTNAAKAASGYSPAYTGTPTVEQAIGDAVISKGSATDAVTGANAAQTTSASSVPTFLTPESKAYYYADGTGVPVVERSISAAVPKAVATPVATDAAAATIPEGAVLNPVTNQPIAANLTYSAEAGGFVPVNAASASAANLAGGSEISADAAAWNAATAGEYGGQAAAGAAGAGGTELATLAAEYGPYVAAAIIADQILFKGQGMKDISNGLSTIDDQILQPVGNFIGGAAKDVGNALGSVKKEASNFVSSIGHALGIGAEGGLTATHARGGIADAFEKPKLQQYNQLGQQLDKDIDTAYQLATTRKQTKKADELKNEMDYRARMKQYQAQLATGGIADHYNLGGYSDGGRLLKGPGDGISDSIPATIGKAKQPARLADGEFVVPARIVSELGNGSTEAGARKLYAMMDRVQAARKKSVGKGKVAVNSRADKFLPT